MCSCAGSSSVSGCSGGNCGSSVQGVMKSARARRMDEPLPPGEPQDGYILAVVLFDYGRPRSYTGIKYPFMTKGEQWFVHEEDVRRNSKLWLAAP